MAKKGRKNVKNIKYVSYVRNVFKCIFRGLSKMSVLNVMLEFKKNYKKIFCLYQPAFHRH